MITWRHKGDQDIVAAIEEFTRGRVKFKRNNNNKQCDKCSDLNCHSLLWEQQELLDPKSETMIKSPPSIPILGSIDNIRKQETN